MSLCRAPAFFIFIFVSQIHAQIVTSIYPIKSILAEIVPDPIYIHCLVPPSASPHIHELLPSDFRLSGKARVLIYGGNGLDKWAEEIPDIQKISILPLVPDSLRLYPENLKKSSFNPHFWTDPLVVRAMLPILADTLCTVFPIDRDKIMNKTILFSNRLDTLNLELKKLLLPLGGTAVLSSHPFFQYFLKRYGFKISGIIEEIPGKEPTPKVIQRIIAAVDKSNIRAVLTHPQLSDRTAQMISESTGIKIIELDPLGGTEGRIRYTDLLMHNARQLKEVLN